MKIKAFIILTIMILSCSLLKAQVGDDKASTRSLNELLMEQIERMAEDSDEEIDFTDLIDSYTFYVENPININSEESKELLELRIINLFQFEQLQNYKKFYGDLLFQEELAMIEGFDEKTIQVIAPIIYFGESREKSRISSEKLINYGKHQLLAKYEQILESSQGYLPITDSALLSSPNSHYLGSPQRYYIEYSYNFGRRIRAGFALEKDPGEPFLFNRLSDTIQQLLGKKKYSGFDYFGFHVFVTDFGIVRAAALGNYQLSFGQGLTMWTGMTFGKATNGSLVMKQARGLRPSASANESKYLRGAAVNLGNDRINGTVFYSIKYIDANISVTDSLDEVEYVSSLQETGYHRTIGEILDRHAILQQVFGGHLNLNFNKLDIGYTAHHTILDATLLLTPTYFNQYYFQGKSLTNQGIDFKYVSGKMALFGEAGWCSGNAFAGLVGLNFHPAGYIDFSILYRNYDKKYRNLFANAMGESSRGQGEEGFFVGLQAAPAPRWQIYAYSDFFRFTWLTSQVYAPSWGHDYYLQLSHQIDSKASFYLRFRSKDKMKNSSQENIFEHQPIHYVKNSAKFNISYSIGENFSLKNNVEFAHYKNDDEADSKGFFVSQDLVFRPVNKNYSLTFRYAIFDTDDYNSRIYAFENDVLYAFSVPAMSGKGMRVYLLGKIKLFNALTIYARIGRTIYADTDQIGSGLTLIEGNHKTDLKIEAIWKF